MHLHCYNFSTLLLAYTSCLYCSCHSIAESGDNFSCNYCDKSYKKTTATSTTNPLWYHLKAAIALHRQKNIPIQQGLIIIFVENKSQQRMYAQLAGADRPLFNQIARSQFIRSALRDKKLVAHSSPTTIRNKVC